jgi:hypothetical protein
MRDVVDKKTWWEATSVAGPAAVQMPGGRPVLGWRGDHNSRNLSLAVIDGPPGSFPSSYLAKYGMADSSDYAPALCYYKGLRLAWVGTNGAHTLNLATVDLPFGGNRVDFTQRAFVNEGDLGAGGQGAPSLALTQAEFGEWLSITCLNGSGQLCSAITQNGANFDSGNEVYWRPHCIEGARGITSPSDSSVSYYAWTDANTNLLGFVRVDGISMHTPVVSAQSSLHAPSLALHNGTVYIAWVGTDGRAHLNVAAIDTNAIDQGRDPIDQVDTLNELSSAAPALRTLPPTEVSPEDFLPERLAIFWSGVDGAGAINAAIVYSE